jgi:hypothetical protein
MNAAAGIISTVDDNYLTTADAIEAEHTVVDSQFIRIKACYITRNQPMINNGQSTFSHDILLS